jgi:hypothetical protein
MKPEEAIGKLQQDLRQVLGPRLVALIVYEAHGTLVHTLAVAQRLESEDLARLAPLAAGWEKAGLALPLFFGQSELARSLDAFPLEFAQILARYRVVAGEDVLAGMAVQRDDLRRACEAQVKSHLLHLREGYLQAAGKRTEVSRLVAASTVPLRALLVNIARLHGVHTTAAEELTAFVEARLQLPAAGLQPVLALSDGSGRGGSDAASLFPGYIAAVERLAALVDEWTI